MPLPAWATASVRWGRLPTSIKGSLRARDTGGAAVNTDSGYSRLLVAPGISASVGNFRVFADVESPVYQNVNGNQLTAKVLYKVVVGMSF